MAVQRVEAIVIRSIDYGEGNKIVTLFTRTEGKVGVVARGAKKPKSRLGAATQPFVQGEYVYYRSGQLGTLNHAEIVHSRHALRENILLAAHAAYMAELADKALQDQEAGTAMFEQFEAALNALEAGKDAQTVLHLFEMKILTATGYRPVLDQCVSCGRTEGPFVLAVASGGLLCAACRGREAHAIGLSAQAQRLLRLFVAADLRRLGKIELKPETKRELKTCMRGLIDHFIGVPFKSRSFLDQMEKYGLSDH